MTLPREAAGIFATPSIAAPDLGRSTAHYRALRAVDRYDVSVVEARHDAAYGHHRGQTEAWARSSNVDDDRTATVAASIASRPARMAS